MGNLLALSQIQAADRWQVGDKALYLSLLLRQGYAVVPGVVVPVAQFRQFLATIDWLEPLFADLPDSALYISGASPQQLQQVAQKIRQSVLTASLSALLPELVDVAAQFESPAVMLRPSVTVGTGVDPTLSARINGLLAAQICPATPGAILSGIKQVWAELFRAKSLLYWQRAGIQLQAVNLAVLIQPLQPARAAGTVQCETSNWQLQAVHGLGLALSRGETVADSYVLAATTGTVLHHQPGQELVTYALDPTAGITATYGDQGSAPPLSPAQLTQLHQLVLQLQNQLGRFLQVEWLLDLDGVTLWLTQVSPWRPLTAPMASEPAGSDDSLAVVVRGIGAAGGRGVAPALVIEAQQQLQNRLPPGRIIVATAVSPDWLPYLQRAAGVVIEGGGLTSHGAILARELGIPAVVGADQATQLIRSGDLIEVDGSLGQVRRVAADSGDRTPSPTSVPGPGRAWFGPSDVAQLPAIATQLMVNLSQPRLLPSLKRLPIDGVGLVRSELLCLAEPPNAPADWQPQATAPELLQATVSRLQAFTTAFAPRPVRYRILDGQSPVMPTDPQAAGATATNPSLGIRGTFSYQLDPSLLDLEIEAIRQVQQAGGQNLQVILPFVRSVEEFSFCRQRIAAAGLFEIPQFQLWIMAEVPSMLFLLPDYIEAGAQGVAIGTNDLSQLLLGADRDQPTLATTYDERHPAVQRAIAQLIQLSQAAGIPCTLCGQAPARYPELVESLVNWGISGISVEPSALETTYRAIVQAEQRLHRRR
jgi:pyruvate,water dikinase